MDNWVEFEQRQQWPSEGDYISLNAKGEFSMNRLLFETLGRPEAVTLHFDPDTNRIGMRRSERSLVNSLTVRERRAGIRAVRSLAFLKQWDIQLSGTYMFPDLRFENNMLVLPLNTRLNVSSKQRR